MLTYDFGATQATTPRRRIIAAASRAGRGLALLITSPLTMLLCAIMAIWVVIGSAIGLAVHFGRRALTATGARY